jgi:hypothetical protein
LLSAILLGGCQSLGVNDVSSLLVPELQRSEVIGFVAGFGTTFAAVPDLLGMFKRRSSKGVNPTLRFGRSWKAPSLVGPARQPHRAAAERQGSRRVSQQQGAAAFGNHDVRQVKPNFCFSAAMSTSSTLRPLVRFC